MKPWMTVEGLYIAAPSKNQDAAFDLVKFLTDVPAGHGPRGPPDPGQQKVYDEPKVAADPVLKAFRAQVETAIPMPNSPRWRCGRHERPR